MGGPGGGFFVLVESSGKPLLLPVPKNTAGPRKPPPGLPNHQGLTSKHKEHTQTYKKTNGFFRKPLKCLSKIASFSQNYKIQEIWAPTGASAQGPGWEFLGPDFVNFVKSVNKKTYKKGV